MRVLCLHGQGASPEIMESQMSSLCAQLPPHWEFDYIESPNESEPAEELKGIYPGPNYAFFDAYTPDSMSEATEYVQETVEEHGPYDGIVGFSQGASVAASYLSRTLTTGSIKFAVFLCAALIPPSKADTRALEATIGSLSAENEKMDVPTLHVVGERDLCYNQSQRLAQNFDAKSAQTIVVYGGGHDMPRDAVTCQKIARGIEKCAMTALTRQ